MAHERALAWLPEESLANLRASGVWRHTRDAKLRRFCGNGAPCRWLSLLLIEVERLELMKGEILKRKR